MYKKIRIVGASGSGKSYLAKKLYEKTKIPMCHMDTDIRFDMSNTFKFENKRSQEEQIILLNKFLKKNSWIIDGSYYSWSAYSYGKADLIIYLEKPLFFRTLNVFRRYFSRLFQGEQEGFFGLMRLLKYNLTEGRIKSKKRLNELKKIYGKKLKVFTSADEAYDWFVSK